MRDRRATAIDVVKFKFAFFICFPCKYPLCHLSNLFPALSSAVDDQARDSENQAQARHMRPPALGPRYKPT
jgi:hypothetical protein